MRITSTVREKDTLLAPVTGFSVMVIVLFTNEVSIGTMRAILAALIFSEIFT